MYRYDNTMIKKKLDIILTLIFMILKLTNVIDWNWIFIFFPIILPVIFFIFLNYIKIFIK